MRLTGAEYTQLEEALVDAYASYDELARMVRRTDARLSDIAAEGPIPSVVSDLIQYAEARDIVHKLIEAARSSNPTNVALLKVSAAIALEPTVPDVEELREDEALTVVSDSFERMVDPQRGIADLGSFAAKLLELLHQVCAVELGNEFGTGFLIGPDTILTNYHVVEKAINHQFEPANIRVRFDYQRRRDGLTVNAGVEHELADGDAWLVDSERYSEVDMKKYDETKTPADHELDYAVLRTKTEVGKEIPSGAVEAKRGWLTPRMEEYDFPVDTFLMVVQHPCHDPISYDDVQDAVIRVNANGTRVHYRTNTMPGSSGSPVLDRKLALVGLHHSGEPGGPDFMLPCNKQVSQASYNEGIPIQKIKDHLKGKGLDSVFGPPLT